ncbi:MAG: four helix bundle protein [Acidobacteriota bacterium]
MQFVWPMAQTLDDLLVWHKAREFWEAVNALLERPGFGTNRDLLDQIRDATDSVVSNIAEGFEQPTDRSFALYLYRSKSSAAEVRARLFIAQRRGYITEPEHDVAVTIGIELARMLAGFIKYLYSCDRKNRGAGQAALNRPQNKPPASRPR